MNPQGELTLHVLNPPGQRSLPGWIFVLAGCLLTLVPGCLLRAGGAPSAVLEFAEPANGAVFSTLDSQQQNRVIAGVAYWFKLQGSVTASLLVDYDAQLFENLTAAPAKTVAVHALVNF